MEMASLCLPHVHTLTLLWLVCFLWHTSTGLPWEQSQAVDRPYHKISVLWSRAGVAMLEVVHCAAPL